MINNNENQKVSKQYLEKLNNAGLKESTDYEVYAVPRAINEIAETPFLVTTSGERFYGIKDLDCFLNKLN